MPQQPTRSNDRPSGRRLFAPLRWVGAGLLLLAPLNSLRGEEGAEQCAPLVATEPIVEPVAGEFEVALASAAETADPGQRPLTFFADLLVWNVREGAADNWAQEIVPPSGSSNEGTVRLIDAPFDWNAGLRVGMVRGLDDGFDVGVAYTNFSTQAANRAAGAVYSAFLGNFYVDNTDGSSFGPHYEEAAVEWDFDFQVIDLEVGRTFAIDHTLSLRPYAGLKAAIIDQSIHTRWQQPIDSGSHVYLFDSAVENVQQDFWGIGPAIGVAAAAPLYATPSSSLRIVASPAASLMYGRWEFSDRYQNDGPTSTTVPTATAVAIDMSAIDGAATMARGFVGVEWVQQFARTTAAVSLGYEAQVWLNQMQFYSFNMGRLNNLTSLQGGIIEVSFDY